MTSTASPKDEESSPPVKVEKKEKPEAILVVWDENEPANPRNWSTPYRCWVTFQLAMLALAASLGSSIISAAENSIVEEMGVSKEVTVLCISLYV
jgi:hypothetical protein